MRTTYCTAVTLDGFLADEHDSLDWLFAQDAGDAGGPFGYDTFIRDIGALVMGATTYEWVRAHLAASGEAWPYAVPAWVLTHRDLPATGGADLRCARVTLGAGRPLLPRPVELRLVEHGRSGDLLCARFDVVGPR